MRSAKRLLLLSVLLASLLLAACGPEAGRVRNGGPGADVGNHGVSIDLHGRSNPYYRAPAVGKGAGK